MYIKDCNEYISDMFSKCMANRFSSETTWVIKKKKELQKIIIRGKLFEIFSSGSNIVSFYENNTQV